MKKVFTGHAFWDVDESGMRVRRVAGDIIEVNADQAAAFADCLEDQKAPEAPEAPGVTKAPVTPPAKK